MKTLSLLTIGLALGFSHTIVFADDIITLNKAVSKDNVETLVLDNKKTLFRVFVQGESPQNNTDSQLVIESDIPSQELREIPSTNGAEREYSRSNLLPISYLRFSTNSAQSFKIGSVKIVYEGDQIENDEKGPLSPGTVGLFKQNESIGTIGKQFEDGRFDFLLTDGNHIVINREDFSTAVLELAGFQMGDKIITSDGSIGKLTHLFRNGKYSITIEESNKEEVQIGELNSSRNLSIITLSGTFKASHEVERLGKFTKGQSVASKNGNRIATIVTLFEDGRVELRNDVGQTFEKLVSDLVL